MFGAHDFLGAKADGLLSLGVKFSDLARPDTHECRENTKRPYLARPVLLANDMHHPANNRDRGNDINEHLAHSAPPVLACDLRMAKEEGCALNNCWSSGWTRNGPISAGNAGLTA